MVWFADSVSGEDLSAATITVLHKHISRIADNNDTFIIPANKGDTLSKLHIGYLTRHMVLSSGVSADNLQIRLAPGIARKAYPSFPGRKP